MGYSCSTKADKVLKELIIQLQTSGDCGGSSNSWLHRGKQCFYEIGQEQRDGAITGHVMKETITGRCHKAGSFRIDRDGRIVRFPTSTKVQRESAMTAGLIKFHEVYGGEWKTDSVLAPLVGNCCFVIL